MLVFVISIMAQVRVPPSPPVPGGSSTALVMFGLLSTALAGTAGVIVAVVMKVAKTNRHESAFETWGMSSVVAFVPSLVLCLVFAPWVRSIFELIGDYCCLSVFVVAAYWFALYLIVKSLD